MINTGMKKCDVEISITTDTGEEHDKMHVPPCLQDAAVESGMNPEHVMSPDTVRLPYRYVQIIGHNKNGQTHPNMDNDLDSREKDLDTALKWIKQEIVSITKTNIRLLCGIHLNIQFCISTLQYKK